MADHDIQNSHHLLKRLEEDMIFLRSLMSQAEVVSSNLQEHGLLLALPMVTGKEISKKTISKIIFLEEGSRMNLFILESMVR